MSAGSNAVTIQKRESKLRHDSSRLTCPDVFLHQYAQLSGRATLALYNVIVEASSECKALGLVADQTTRFLQRCKYFGKSAAMTRAVVGMLKKIE